MVESSHTTVSCINNFYSLLEKELELINHDPSHLFNIDEAGFGGRQKRSTTKVITEKGVRQVLKTDIKI